MIWLKKNSKYMKYPLGKKESRDSGAAGEIGQELLFYLRRIVLRAALVELMSK